MRLLFCLILTVVISTANYAQIRPDSLAQDSLHFTSDNEVELSENFRLDLSKSTSFLIGSTKINQLPVRDFNDLLKLNPSLIIQDEINRNSGKRKIESE